MKKIAGGLLLMGFLFSCGEKKDFEGGRSYTIEDAVSDSLNSDTLMPEDAIVVKPVISRSLQ